ncbi:alpha/beta hydrolase [Microbispora sp. H13382]|uniref:alpha/beta hydrolase n=1 Tax=Microbispora sp. H13382 TaxID=2729112 RepID=UPI0015FEF1D8|nr:alpha/beta hydrolase [Microbispora sp. H13382]
MRPGYLTLPSGQVHLRQAGAGSPVLLLHDAPGCAGGWDPELIETIAGRRWVIAPDLIGFGGTTVDDGAAGDLDVQADMLAAALTLLGVRRTPVAAEGAGAAVAARLAERHPGLVHGFLVLHVPYGGAERPPAPSAPDGSGGHLLRLYDEVRDSLVFSPWWRPSARNRRSRGLPSAEVLHALFLETADHGDAHRRLASSAAEAWPGVAGLSGMAVAGDDWAADILALPEGDVVAEPAKSESGERDYVEVSTGVVHVRRFGAQSSGRRPVLMLHANPGSGSGLEPLARALGETRTVLVWDTPGHGRSTPLPGTAADAPTLGGTYVPLLVELLDAQGIETCDVYGTHTGAAMAVELAVAAPDRVGALVLDGVPLFDDQPELVASVMENYFVDLTPDTHGSHLRRAWGASADMALWWPWFNHTPEGVRDVDAYRPEFLHRVVLDMLRSAPHYHRYYRAAWQWPCTERLPLVKRPVLVGSTLTDPLAPMTPVALRLLRDATEATFAPLGAPGSPEANAVLLARYLDGIA